MSLNKAVQYEEVPLKVNKLSGRGALIKSAERLNSFTLVFILVKRHKIGLLAIGNTILVLNWIFPAWPELVKSLI